MSLTWGRGKEEMTITTSGMSSDMLQRGDRIAISGMVNAVSNGVFVVRRAKGNRYICEPAGWWDYTMHYAKKLGDWVRWHYYGVIDTLRERIRCLFT